MPHTATVTAKTGPAVQNTAIVYSNVRKVDIDPTRGVIEFIVDPPAVAPPATPISIGNQVKEYDLVGVTVLTCTITGGNYAFVVS